MNTKLCLTIMTRVASLVGWLCAGLLLFATFGSSVFAQQTLQFSKPGPLDYSAQISEDILREAYARIGIRVATDEFPGERALIMSNSGNTDGEVNRIRGISRKYPNLRIIPVAINSIEGLAFAISPNITIRKWQDLQPYIVGLRIGAKYAEYGTAGMKVTAVATNDQVFDMLDQRRTDVAISTRIEGVLTIKKLGLTGIRPMEPPLVTLKLFHFLHKKHLALVPRITLVLEEMAKEGRIKAIKDAAIRKLHE
jgi:polar amino acid transport system substrate-binding protein